MTINPTQLKPTELVRLLNSAGLGQVISDSVLHRHRNAEKIKKTGVFRFGLT